MSDNSALAKGARSHTFPSNSHISDARWRAIFGPRDLESAVDKAMADARAAFKPAPKKKKKK